MGDHRLLSAMAVIGLVLVAVIVYSTLRFKRNRDQDFEAVGRRVTMVADGHLAHKISPFSPASPAHMNPAGEAPRFVHQPGQNMRIAIRRPDGGWEFNSSRAGFSPNGVDEVTPLPTTPRHMYSHSISSSAMLSTKSGFSRKKGFEAEYEFEPSPDILPPPAYAYGHDTPSYTKQDNDIAQSPPPPI